MTFKNQPGQSGHGIKKHGLLVGVRKQNCACKNLLINAFIDAAFVAIVVLGRGLNQKTTSHKDSLSLIYLHERMALQISENYFMTFDHENAHYFFLAPPAQKI